MLAAKFTFAMAPTAVRDHRGEARIGAAGINRHGAAKARTDGADALRIDGGMRGKKGQCIAKILDLFETDHAAEFTFALAAPAHVETQCDIAEIVKHTGWLQHIAAVRIRAEAV